MKLARPSLQGVVQYLDNCARIADFTHNLDQRRHYQTVVEFVLLHTHGPLPCRQPLKKQPQRELAPIMKATPPWKLQVLARPLRKVVSHREVELWTERKGETYKMRRLVLSCGHVMDEMPIGSPNLIPQRRRCRQCAQQQFRERMAANG